MIKVLVPLIFIAAFSLISATPVNTTSDCTKCQPLSFDIRKIYEKRNCTAVKKPGCDDCIISYQCPPFSNLTAGCEYFGKIYEPGQDIDTGNDCNKCSCSIHNILSCVYVECPGQVFGQPPYPRKYLDPAARDAEFEAKYKHCYYSNLETGCCGKADCPTPEQYLTLKRCNHNNQTYLLGQSFELADGCKSCICTEDFNETNPAASKSCKDIDCSYNFEKLKKGCHPVFFKNEKTTCCPISYECPPPPKAEREKICSQPAETTRCSKALITLYTFNSTSKKCESYDSHGCASSRNNFETLEECDRFCVKPDQPLTLYTNDEPKCEFGSERYEIGAKFKAGKSECECLVPPIPVCKGEY